MGLGLVVEGEELLEGSIKVPVAEDQKVIEQLTCPGQVASLLRHPVSGQMSGDVAEIYLAVAIWMKKRTQKANGPIPYPD